MANRDIWLKRKKQINASMVWKFGQYLTGMATCQLIYTKYLLCKNKSWKDSNIDFKLDLLNLAVILWVVVF